MVFTVYAIFTKQMNGEFSTIIGDMYRRIEHIEVEHTRMICRSPTSICKYVFSAYV